MTGDDDAYGLPSLDRVTAPEAAEPPVKRDKAAVGVLDLDPALAKALAKWAARARVTLRQEGHRTWITPKLISGEEREIDITADGKLLADNDELRRLDTGKHARFPAWTKSFTAMSGETFDGMVHISLGPRSDRAVILSLARMGAGPIIGSAILVDTGSMKQIATLDTSCEPHEVVWSPRGSWFVREPCNGSEIASAELAIDAETGRVIRKVPSMVLGFAGDDHTVVSGGVVVDLATGERGFAVPGMEGRSDE